MKGTPIVVSEWDLRAMFNAGRFPERAASGELRAIVSSERHPSSPKAPVPYCTRSQMISYLDRNGKKLAMAHQYLRPDGTLGASGKPDPKRVVHDGVLYYVVASPRSR